MDVKKRVMTCRVIEKIEKNKKAAEMAGVYNISTYRNELINAKHPASKSFFLK